MNHHSSHKKRWLIISGIALLFFVVVLFFDADAIIDMLRQANWGVWLIGIAFLLGGYAFNTVRWQYLLSGNPGLLSLFYGDSIAYMSNMVTPIPTAISRIFTTDWTTSASETQATSSMVIDRLLETTMRLIATIFAITLLATRGTDATSSILINLGIVVLGVAGLVWIIKHQALVVEKVAHWLSRLPALNEDQVRKTVGAILQNLAFAGSTSHLMVGLAISIVMWLFFLVFQYLALTALQPASADIDHQTLLAALVVLAIIPPSTTAMVGLYHLIVIAALVGFRLLDIPTATAYAILLHLPQMVFWLLAGMLAYKKTDIEFKQLLEAVREYRHKDQNSLETGEA